MTQPVLSSRDGTSSSYLDKSELEVLKEQHQFVRNDDDDKINSEDWKVRMARRYYDQLYKEFAIIDLSRCEEGMIGLRWQTEKEVLCGKGQTSCGARQCISENISELVTYELPFSYVENGNNKLELVKVSLCGSCGKKLKIYKKKQRMKETIEREVPDASKEKVRLLQKKRHKS